MIMSTNNRPLLLFYSILLGMMMSSVCFSSKSEERLLPPVESVDGIPLGVLRSLYGLDQQTSSAVTTDEFQVDFKDRMKILVTGGAGFVGSHLVDRLLLLGHTIIVVDNLHTGNKSNLSQWKDNPRLIFIEADVSSSSSDLLNRLKDVNEIYHLACPAAPDAYQSDPVYTLKTSFIGTMNMLNLAVASGAKFLLASTSEIYGDPLEHPQRESYWGHVNPIGPRSCYDEGKRSAESLVYAYKHNYGQSLDVRVARIFNTYGPRMAIEDGRVVANFISRSLKREPMEIYGSGKQTRSFMYVHDLVSGLIKLMQGPSSQFSSSELVRDKLERPFNIGNPNETTIEDFANIIQDYVHSKYGFTPQITKKAALIDDPQRRCPDIHRAQTFLQWSPIFSLEQGIFETIEYFEKTLFTQDKSFKEKDAML